VIVVQSQVRNFQLYHQLFHPLCTRLTWDDDIVMILA